MRHDIYQLTDLLKQENFQPTSFIEIGSRDGEDTHCISYYFKINPVNCFIIEAHPQCFKNIISKYPQYRTFNIAASDKTGTIKFNAGIFGKEENIGVSSVLNRTLSPFISEQVEVDGWRMEEVMNQINISKFDFMKIDVEGLGLQVLEGFGEKIKHTKYIQIELETSQVWENQSYYDDVVNYLKSQGFEILNEVDLDGIQKDVLFKNINYDFNSNS
jgi:FkbM family methyltransferase